MSRDSTDLSTGETIFVLVAIVALFIGVFVICGGQPLRQPPTPNASVLDVVRWCEPNARESYKDDEDKTRWRDSPDMFLTCMKEYGWQIKRYGDATQ